MDVEETLDVVKDTTNEGGVAPIIVGLFGVGAGLLIGYILGRRKSHQVITLGDLNAQLSRPPRVIIDEDELDKDRGLVVDEIVVDEPLEETDRKTIERVSVPVEEAVTVNSRSVEHRSIFAQGDLDQWDLDEEIKKRNPLNPYIIHRDEFFAEDPSTDHLIQSQLTFYEGDGVLCDEQNTPIYDISETVGSIVWGKGSGDPNVCYIRNMVKNAEYEVIRDEGHYSIEVLHLDMEAEEEEKDTKSTKVRRMRKPE